ncbi:MAG: CrcB family protein [Lactobacillaceae bacterium]|jgi:fluoride ion exporter CrcB/FEX|nr:CrcB family protein [Lactobacillaceae bacterium]
MLSLFLISVGSGIGAVLRHLWIKKFHNLNKNFTRIWQINVFGSFIAGILFGLKINDPFITLGIISGFTTFSTMSVEGTNQKGPYFPIIYFSGLITAFIGITLGGLIRG